MPPGQASTKGPVSHHVARPQSTNKPCTASEPRPQDKRHTIHGSQCVQITLPAAATHCSSATLPRVALQLDAPVVVLRNAATVPSSQLQLSTQANVSIVLYGLQPDRRCSPGSVTTGYPCPQQNDIHPSLSPASTKLLVTHCVSALEFCWRLQA